MFKLDDILQQIEEIQEFSEEAYANAPEIKLPSGEVAEPIDFPGLVKNLKEGNQSIQASLTTVNVFKHPKDIGQWIDDTQPTQSNCAVVRDSDTTPSPVGGTPLRMLVTGNDPHVLTYGLKKFNLSEVTMGQVWEFSVYVKSTKNTTCQLFIFQCKEDGSVEGVSANTVDVTDQWQLVSHTATINEPLASTIQVRLDGPNSGGLGDYLWFDGMSVSTQKFGNISEASSYYYTSLDTQNIALDQLNNVTTELGEALDDVNTNLTQVSTDLTETQIDLNSTKQSVADLESDLASVSTTLQQSVQNINNLGTELTQTNENIDKLDSSIATFNVFKYSSDLYSWLEATEAIQGNEARAFLEAATSPVGNKPIKLLVYAPGVDPHFITFNSAKFNLAPIQKGQTWRAEIYVKSTVPTTASITLFEADGSGKILENQASNIVGSVTTGWTKISATRTIQSTSAKFLQLRLNGPANSAAGSYVLFDGLVVTNSGLQKASDTMSYFLDSFVETNTQLGTSLSLRQVTTKPNSSTAAGEPGQYYRETGFFYLCVENNKWIRFATEHQW